MHKEVERAVLRITKAAEKNRMDFAEARGNYADTGYDRYYKKMEKLDAEYEELTAFLHMQEKADVQPETIMKLNELKQAVKNIKTKWDYMCRDLNLPYTTEIEGINNILQDIKQIID